MLRHLNFWFKKSFAGGLVEVLRVKDVTFCTVSNTSAVKYGKTLTFDS